MTIGIYSIELHLPGARSLKGKRQVTKRVKDRLRSRYNVAVSEVDGFADLWQRAELVVVSVAGRRDALEQLFEAVHRETSALVPGEVIECGREFIEGSDGGPSGWSGDWS
jgi:uncharacterized protein YlxP (DUF503 family)